jgi:protoporphyrin/coproporphyrin ferrochelatase
MTNYSAYVDQADYAHGSSDCLGVLMVNLGTPDAPTPQALRRYLRQFLNDPRVIELPRWQWLPILEGIVLRTRPRRVARAYAEIWTDEGSPLMAISRKQQAALEAVLARRARGKVRVALGMSYGNPSIPRALAELREAGARRIILLPMYPQYSGSTTASAVDATFAELSRWRWVPEFRMIQHYADDPGYVRALAASIREYRAEHGSGELLLFSFHGVPKRYRDNGDPYHCLCHKTARLVAEELGLGTDDWMVTFQSRFGREPWLQPYTDETIQALGKKGLRRIDAICAGFSADCLETLEEIAGENREYFEEAGGEALHYIPCLNEREDHIEALADLVMRHCGGWPETDPNVRLPGPSDYDASRERAIAMGAPR